MRFMYLIILTLFFFSDESNAQVGRPGSCARCDNAISKGEGGMVVQDLESGRRQTVPYCDPCYTNYRGESTWKVSEATAEDYAESDRYWAKQGKILDRLGKEVRIFDGREILVPKGSPKSDAWWADHTKNNPDKKSWGHSKKSRQPESLIVKPVDKPKRIVIYYKDGTIVVYEF